MCTVRGAAQASLRVLQLQKDASKQRQLAATLIYESRQRASRALVTIPEGEGGVIGADGKPVNKLDRLQHSWNLAVDADKRFDAREQV